MNDRCGRDLLDLLVIFVTVVSFVTPPQVRSSNEKATFHFQQVVFNLSKFEVVDTNPLGGFPSSIKSNQVKSSFSSYSQKSRITICLIQILQQRDNERV